MSGKKTGDQLSGMTAHELCNEMRKFVRSDHGQQSKRDGILRALVEGIADGMGLVDIMVAWHERQRQGILERQAPYLEEFELRALKATDRVEYDQRATARRQREKGKKP